MITTLQDFTLDTGRRFVLSLSVVCLVELVPLVFASPLPAHETDSLALVQAFENVLSDIIERNSSSVVAVARVWRQRIAGPFSRESLPFELRGLLPDPKDPNFVPHDFGTGVVVDANGLILTNYHVLGRDDEQVKTSSFFVTTSPGNVYEAKIRAADPWSDLAVLEISAKDLKPIQFGDATGVRPGAIVVALGNPYAVARDGRPSASWGILSNRSRKQGVAARRSLAGGRETMHHHGTLLQTDAKLSWGASGGALMNLRGEMIGLTVSLSAAVAFESAAGYAIPVDPTFQRIVDRLRSGKEVEYGFLGVGPENIASPSVESENVVGVRLRQVLPGTPAARAGLLVDDIVTHIGEDAVVNTDQFMLFIGQYLVGAQVPLRIRRGAAELSLEVTLTKKPIVGSRSTIVTGETRWWRGLRFDYATASAAFTELSESSVPDSSQYVAVTDVLADTPAWQGGVRSGMFISHAVGQRVDTPDAFIAAVKDQTGPVELRFAVYREGEDATHIIESVRTDEN